MKMIYECVLVFSTRIYKKAGSRMNEFATNGVSEGTNMMRLRPVDN